MTLNKKIFAIFLSLLLALSVCACSSVPLSLTKQWSYRTAEKEISIGVYIYALYNAYSKAEGFAKKAEGYKENESFLHLEITDDDGNKAIAEDWIYEEADRMSKSILAVDQELEKLGLTASPDQIQYAKDSAKDDWELGPYASYYAQFGYTSTPLKNVLEKFGVSFNSFYEASYRSNVLQSKLFDSLYNEGGTKAVTDAELKTFFLENYTYYSYFKIDLTSPDTSTDDESAPYVAMTDEQKKPIKASMDKYAEAINKNGKKFSEVVSDYMKDYNVESDPSVTNSEILNENSSLAAEIAASLKSQKEDTAVVLEVGADTSAAYYLVYKGKIADAAGGKISDSRYEVLTAMKKDDFTDYVKDLAANLKCEVNTKVIKRYKASMFESFTKDKATPDEQ